MSNSHKKGKRISKAKAQRRFFTSGLLFLIYILIVTYFPPLVSRYLQVIGSPLSGNDGKPLILGVFYLVYVLSALILFSIYARANGVKRRDFMRPCRFSFLDYLKDAILITSLLFVGIFLSSMMLNPLGFNDAFVAPIGMVQPDSYLREPLFMFLFIGVTPLIEEFAFRGVLLRDLGRYGNRFGIIAVALLYAFAHTSATEYLPAFILSVCLSLMTLRYHNILPGVIVHITINVLFLGSTFVPERYSWTIVATIGLLYAVSVYLLLSRKYQPIYVSRQRNLGYTLRLFLTTPSVLLTVILMIVQSAFAYFLYR